MSSLPQGWQALGPPKKSTPGSSTQPTPSLPTVRKKWNSPQVSEVPKSRLPSYRKSSIPPMPNGYQSRATPPTRNSANSSSTTLKNRLPECPPRFLTKSLESQAELASLKKEFATIKAENSILKAKVRRVDDENSQKSRQIDKLRTEMKTNAAKCNDMGNNKKNKESESLLLIRQKCLRLESALKEKDAAMKKLVNEIKSVKIEELKSLVESYHKELGNNNGLGNGSIFKNHKLPSSNGNQASAKPGKINIKDQSVKSEVVRMRDMIHKLQNESRNFQIQVQEKEQEIRRLKLQLHRQVPKPTSGPSATPNRRLSQSSIKSNGSTARKTPVSNTTFAKEKQSSNSLTTASKRPKTTASSRSITKPGVLQRQTKTESTVSTRIPSATRPNSTFVVAKGEPKQKLVIRKPRSATQIILTNDVDVESRVQNMRQNVAARKIQRSWRHHRQLINSKDVSEEEEKALMLIESVLKDHKVRKDRLIDLIGDGATLQLSMEEQLAILQGVQTTVETLWSKEKDEY